MRTETVNNAIFYVAALVFVLNAVGYLAPGWFVQESVIRRNSMDVYAGDQLLNLPRIQSQDDGIENERDTNPEYFDEVQKDTGTGASLPRRPSKPPRPLIPEKRTSPATKSPPGANSGDTSKEWDDDQEGMEQKCPEGVDCTKVRSGGGDSVSDNGDTRPEMTPGGGDIMPPCRSELCENNLDKPVMEDESGMKMPKTNQVSHKKHTRPTAANLKAGDHVLYVTDGFWYSSACVTTSKSRGGLDRDGTQWCTMYTKTNHLVPRNVKNLFELRIEATVGVALSFLGLIITSTGCCSQRYHGRRTIVSLVSLFVSGVVMTIPVVHVIILHVREGDDIVRTRDWSRLLHQSHLAHDMFDHYSVILCAAGSLVAILATVIIAIVKYQYPSTLGNAYKLDRNHDVVQERKEELELPVNWLTNQIITLPPATEKGVTATNNDTNDSESGYSDIRDDVTVSIIDSPDTESSAPHTNVDNCKDDSV